MMFVWNLKNPINIPSLVSTGIKWITNNAFFVKTDNGFLIPWTLELPCLLISLWQRSHCRSYQYQKDLLYEIYKIAVPVSTISPHIHEWSSTNIKFYIWCHSQQQNLFGTNHLTEFRLMCNRPLSHNRRRSASFWLFTYI